MTQTSDKPIDLTAIGFINDGPPANDWTQCGDTITGLAVACFAVGFIGCLIAAGVYFGLQSLVLSLPAIAEGMR